MAARNRYRRSLLGHFHLARLAWWVVPALPLSTFAAQYNYTGASGGNWATAANWTLNGGSTHQVPVNGDLAVITGTSVNFNATYSGAGLNTLTLNSAAFASSLNQTTASTMIAATEIIGGTTVQNSYVQSAGSNTVTSELSIGDQSGGTGSYALSGTGTLSASNEYFGFLGMGTFNQTGGTNTVTSSLWVAYFGPSGSSYTLSAGSLIMSNAYLDVGPNVQASFNQSGGLLSFSGISGQLSIASSVGGQNSTYTLSGTGQITGAAAESVAGSGTGIFNQTGGSNTLAGGGALSLGTSGSGNGTYNLSASSGTGALNADFENIGQASTGTFNQNGGTNTVNVSLNLAPNSFSTGTYNLNAGMLTVGGNTYVGGSSSGAGGPGVMNIPGGIANLYGTLKIWNTSGTAVNLSGGTLGVIAIDTSGNNARFNWTSGTLNFLNGATIDANFILGSSPTITAGKTLGAADTYALTNNGSVTLAGGALGGGFIVNNTVLGGNGGIALSDALINNGQINQSGGNLSIYSAMGVTNYATINLAAGWQLQLTGNTLVNNATINLNGGTITGASQVSNTAGGVVAGPGTINVPLANSGTLYVPNGTTRAGSFTNTGVVEMAGGAAQLGPGGTITNQGTIEGFGKVSDGVINGITTISPPSNFYGTIEATGGNLVFSGPMTNSATGTIRTAAGTKVLMLGTGTFSANAGLISLAGGSFDNGGQPLNNTGQITGYGVLATGGLTNNGLMTLTGGTSTVNGDVTNAPGQTINIKYQPAIFTGNIFNNGTIKTTNTTVTFVGAYTGNAYISDPSTNIFQGSVTIVPDGAMTGGSGDQYDFSGGPVVNNGTFSNGGTLQASVNVTNTGSFTQSGSQTWSAGTTFTNSAGTANFLSDAGSPGGFNLTISVMAGAVNLAGPQHLQSLSLAGGVTTLAATPVLPGPAANRNPSASALVVNSLAIAGGAAPAATLNLNNNLLIIKSGGASARNNVEADISYARDGGAWDRPGITSTTAQATHIATGFDSLTLGDILNSDLATPYTSFGGQAASPGDVLVALTYGGDANLNGIVNGDDYFQIDQGFVNHLTGWINGDFNHDGVVNGDDYFIIDSNFVNQSGQLAAGEVLGHEAEFGPAYLSGFTSAQLAVIGVPEPGGLALLGLGVGLMIRRRR